VKVCGKNKTAIKNQIKSMKYYEVWRIMNKVMKVNESIKVWNYESMKVWKYESMKVWK
jgi:hypothetical protein